MTLKFEEIYHVYNRGNNRHRLFYNKRNYPYFLSKIRKYVSPYCDILAYCLMPNHFHLLIYANEKTGLLCKIPGEGMTISVNDPYVRMTRFSHGMQLLLSSYAKAINKSHNRSGSLFKQNTRSKQTSSEGLTMDYTLWCFIYIHNNPVVSGLVGSPEEWAWSSYHEYQGKSTHPICNIELGKKLLSLEINELVEFNGCEIPGHIIDKIF